VVVRDGTWYLHDSNTTGIADSTFRYGNSGDAQIMGDWNGDGNDTPGVVRGDTWYLRNSNTTGVAHVSFRYGNAGDTPLVRDRAGGGEPQRLERGDRGPAVTRLQERLDALGFWVGPKDGIFGELTEQAVFAIQKYHFLPATGVVEGATREKIDRGPHVQAAATHGDVVEVDKYRQLVFIVRNGLTLWAFNTSTGDNEPYIYNGQQYIADTPSGHFEIFRQIDGWRESHLGRLYRPKYFTYNGIALHGYTFVPPYPVSHGCVRVTMAAIDYIWEHDLAPIGTTVHLYGQIPS
jgi:lipoprotein-anchoring transpeptidase ErfK/SrfK